MSSAPVRRTLTGSENIPAVLEQLLERDREIAVMREQVTRVQAGSGSLIVIEGPAGIGKTRLLDAALVIAGAAGLTSHRARGSVLERGIPHSITRQLFEPRLAHAGEAEREELLRDAAASAATVFFGPDLGAGSPGESPFAVLHGLYWMVVNLAERGPLALAVDDAHWADAASLRALAYMANRLADVPILMVLAMRPFEPDAEHGLLDEIASHPLACPVRPAALSEGGAGELLEQTLGEAVDPAFARACHEVTSGNPFFLKEILSEIVAEGVSPTAAEAGRAFNLAPPTVARSVQRRLERLPDPALALARAVAILAESPRPLVAAEVSGLEPSDASDSAAVLSRAEILKPESLEFAHPVVRSVVYSGMSPVERGELHRHAARALANARAPDSEVAAQLLAARPHADEWCVEFLREAARSAMARGAPDLATSYLERALSEPPPADDKPSILLELGTAAVAASGPDGVPFLREALGSVREPSARVPISLQLAGSLFSQGYFPDAAEVLEEALGHLPQGDRGLIALLEGQLNVIALTDLSVLGRFGGLRSLLERVAAEGETANRVRVAVHAWIVTAAIGPAGNGARLAEQVLDGLALTHDPLAFVTAATALMGAGRHAEARQAWDGAIADARRDGSLARLGLAATLRAPVSFRLGSVTAAEADAREVFDRASEADRLGAEVQMPLSWVLAPLIDALLERGEVEEAARAVEQCEIGDDLPELLQFNYLLDSLGRLRLAEGRASEGIAHLRECGRRLEAWEIDNPGFVPWRATLGYALAGVGEREEALELARAEHEAARRFGVAREEGLALRAMARALGGEREIELLRESVQVLEASTAALDLAGAQLDLGAALRRRGLRSEAREPLRRALDLAQRCGSRAVAERAHSELLASGARPRKLQLSGVESLTAGERRVADLAAEGLTNRQIAEALYLTQKTIEGHLGNTFRKLDISSRTQLADRFATGS